MKKYYFATVVLFSLFLFNCSTKKEESIEENTRKELPKTGRLIYKKVVEEYLDIDTLVPVDQFKEYLKYGAYELTFKDNKSRFEQIDLVPELTKRLEINREIMKNFHLFEKVKDGVLAKNLKGVYSYDKNTNKLERESSILDSVFRFSEEKRYAWIFTKEQKKIKGYTCFKAIIDNEKHPELREDDPIEVWFTKELGFPYGPFNFVNIGGLVLEFKNRETTYRADSLELNIPMEIEIPKEGKRISIDQWEAYVIENHNRLRKKFFGE